MMQDTNVQKVLSEALYEQIVRHPQMREAASRLCGEQLSRDLTADARQRAEGVGKRVRGYLATDLSADNEPGYDTAARFNADCLRYFYEVCVDWTLVGRLLLQHLLRGR